MPRLLDELVSRPIARILLNSNGVLIARDDTVLDLPTRHQERVEVYLQYDGVSAESSRHHRGGDHSGLRGTTKDTPTRTAALNPCPGSDAIIL
jgi:uncharacterized radical SAM superfamily Fe-S cluster-containing enzyme